MSKSSAVCFAIRRRSREPQFPLAPLLNGYPSRETDKSRHFPQLFQRRLRLRGRQKEQVRAGPASHTWICIVEQSFEVPKVRVASPTEFGVRTMQLVELSISFLWVSTESRSAMSRSSR